jgi:hypothetical protein
MCRTFLDEKKIQKKKEENSFIFFLNLNQIIYILEATNCELMMPKEKQS